jgi:hypothetical protein
VTAQNGENADQEDERAQFLRIVSRNASYLAIVGVLPAYSTASQTNIALLMQAWESWFALMHTWSFGRIQARRMPVGSEKPISAA